MCTMCTMCAQKADWPEHHKMMLDKAEDAFRLATKVRDDVEIIKDQS